MITGSAKRPDIEITKKYKDGSRRSLVIVYFKPFKLWILGKTIINFSQTKGGRGNEDITIAKRLE